MKNKPYLIKSQVGGVKCKFLFAFFAALLILMGNSQAYADEEPKSITKDGLIYTLHDGKSASVSVQYTNISGEITILSEVTIDENNYPVTEIEDNGFNGCDRITSVTIPGSVETIGNSAFAGCEMLESITFEEGVKYIGDEAFYQCSILKQVTLPESLTELGRMVFKDCIMLGEINIPKSLTIIGDNPFHGCNNLATITIAADHPVYSFDDGFLIENGTKTIAYIIRYNASVEIPDGIETIGEGTFDGCQASNFRIPNSVEAIEDFAFANCPMQSITIPNSVYSIGDCVFDGCEKLETIEIDNYEDCIWLVDCKFPDGVTVKYIRPSDYFAFTPIGNTNTVKVKFGGNKLTGAITIPAEDGNGNKVVAIAKYGFFYQPEITSVTILEGVTSIGMWAFFGCAGLTSVSIPSTVTDMSMPFSYCSSLKNIDIADGSPFTFSNGFLIKNIKDENGIVTEQILVEYLGNDVNVVVPDGVTKITEGAFIYNTVMESLFIPESVVSIEEDFLDDCERFKYVYVDNKRDNFSKETANM